MADQSGRCSNIEYCREAVSKRVIFLAEGAGFECPRCGHALNCVGASRPWWRSRTLLALSAAVVLFGVAALTWTLTKHGGMELLPLPTSTAQAASQATPDQGPTARNVLLRLASADAASARAALALEAITPGRVVAFGADLPVADNATPEGQERNLRVEVYRAPP